MSTSLICVECGENIDSLYVEYSEGNIKLTRCTQCSKVSDKYIEYETILVMIDVILHRKQAYRHILFNRHQFDGAKNSIRWTLVGIIAINTLLKFIVLHDTVYHSWRPMALIAHLIISSVLEHIAFVLFSGLALILRNDIQVSNSSMYGKYFRRLYFAIAFPEYFKLIAIVLQVFDSESELLTLFGLLLLSITCLSVQSLTRKPFSRIAPIILFAALFKLLIKMVWYNRNSILLHGIII